MRIDECASCLVIVDYSSLEQTMNKTPLPWVTWNVEFYYIQLYVVTYHGKKRKEGGNRRKKLLSVLI